MISENSSGCEPSFLDRSAESVGGAIRHRRQNSVLRACLSCRIPAYWLDSLKIGSEGNAVDQGRGSADDRPLLRLGSDDRWEARVPPCLLGAQGSPVNLEDFRIVAWQHAKPRRCCRTDHRPLGLGMRMWEEHAAVAGRGSRDRASRHSDLHQRGTPGKADKRALSRDLSPDAFGQRGSGPAACEPAVRCRQRRILGLVCRSVALTRFVASRLDHGRGFDRLWQLNDSLLNSGELNSGDNQTWGRRFTGDG